MFHDSALAYLASLRYREDAERRQCILPLGGIYWADEIPDFNEVLKLPQAGRSQVYRLFRIRFRLWASDPISSADQAYWDAAVAMFPDCPIMKRVCLSAEDQAAEAAVVQEAVDGFAVLTEGADRIKVTQSEDGVQCFYIEIDLTKSDRPPVKRRWWHRWTKRE